MADNDVVTVGGGDYEVWNGWATTSNATVTSDTNITWHSWTNELSQTYNIATNSWLSWQAVGTTNPLRNPVRSAEAQKEHERLVREKQRNRDRAEQRAEELLLMHLDDQQKKHYQAHRRFRVKVGDTTYEFNCKKRQHNIFEVESGILIREYCIYQTQGLPLADNILGQKLLLEANEPEFKRIANQTRACGNSPIRIAA